MTASPLDEPDTGRLDEPLMTVLVSRSPRGLCLYVRGEVDSASAPQLREQLAAAVASDAAEVVVDLTAVDFLDSAGLCALAVTHKEATARGTRMRVLAATRAVVRPLQVTGLWDLLGAEHVERLAPA
jgi:anti-sigma B factor antagonist